MKNAFVFYESFYDILQMLPSAEDWRMLIEAVCEYAFTGERDPLPTPALEIAFKHFQISIDSASARYDKAVEEGKKGGRPHKWVDRTEAERLFAEHKSWAKVAEIMDVSDDTLYRARMKWKNTAKPQNPQNLNVSISDSVSVSESDSVSDSDIRNNNSNPSQTADGADAPPPAPEEKMEWFTEGVNYGPPDWESEPPE